jgi:hypothetical protein
MRWLVLYRCEDADLEADLSPHHLVLIVPGLPFVVPLLLLVLPLLLLLLLQLLLLLLLLGVLYSTVRGVLPLLLPPQAILLKK